MRFVKRISCIMPAILLFSCLMGCSAIESKILTIEEHNLSLNLSPEYQKQGDIAVVGMLSQTLSINDTQDPSGKNASIVFMTFLSEQNETSIDPAAFSEYMGTMMEGAYKLAGAKEAGSLTVLNSNGENVTIKAWSMTQKADLPAKNQTYFAYWSLDTYNSLFLTSNLDLNTTAEIVKTLTIKP